MDCITISTYRNLEQQAIRQYKESKVKEAAHSRPAFTMENPIQDTTITATNAEKVHSNSNNKGLDYYA